MSLLNRMKDSVSSAGIGVSQKFSYTAETMKLNNKIRNNEKEIEKLIAQVGQRCLELHFDDSDSEYEEFFTEIRRYQEENEKHQAEIQRLSEEEQAQARQRQLEMQQRQEQREQERKEREAKKQQEALLKQQEEQLKKQEKQLKQQEEQLKQQEERLRQKELQKRWDQATWICPKCGERNDPDAKFCVHCGNPYVNSNDRQEKTQQDDFQTQTETVE